MKHATYINIIMIMHEACMEDYVWNKHETLMLCIKQAWNKNIMHEKSMKN